MEHINPGPDPYLNKEEEKELGVFVRRVHPWDMAKLESKLWQLQKPLSSVIKKEN